MVNESVKRRVLGSMLSKYEGCNVTVIGTFQEAEANGKAFKILTTDLKTITIRLENPIQEYIEGMLQIQGVVYNDTTISASKYTPLPSSEPINEKLYNEAINLIEKYPSHY